MSIIDAERGGLTPGAAHEDAPTPPITYRLNPARVTLRELWMENRTPLALLAWVVLKGAGGHVPASVYDEEWEEGWD